MQQDYPEENMQVVTFIFHADILFPELKQLEMRQPVLATPGNVAMGNAWFPSPSLVTQS